VTVLITSQDGQDGTYLLQLRWAKAASCTASSAAP